MGFKFIQQVQQRESRSHNLTKLPADFFANLSLHIAGLRQLAREEMARDPLSTTATLVQNELRNTLSLAQDIVLLRLRKMANRAVDSLEGGRVDIRALTPKEKDLYGEISRFMAMAHSQLSPDGGKGGTPQAGASTSTTASVSASTTPPATPVPSEPEAGPAQAVPPAEGTVAAETKVDGDGEGPTLIHVLRDTAPFAGDDGQTYSLKKGDVVSLPDRLAQVLVSRGMAEEVRSQG